VLNAANEVAVAGFLEGAVRFNDIASTCAAALDALPARAVSDLDDALRIDADARRAARTALRLPPSLTDTLAA